MTEMDDAEAIESWQGVPGDFAAEFGEEGDAARRFLLNPALFRLLGDVKDKAILDAGCGQGYLARILAVRGARVTAFDPSKPLIEYAMGREEQERLGIRYLQQDIAAFRDAGQVYDVVVANMVLMDVPNYRRALDTCFACLRSGGQLICSLVHPCFESSDAEFAASGYVAVREYLAEYTIPQRWGVRFHRPLSHYLNAIIERGGYLRSITEPEMDPSHAQRSVDQERNLHVPAFIVIEASKDR